MLSHLWTLAISRTVYVARLTFHGLSSPEIMSHNPCTLGKHVRCLHQFNHSWQVLQNHLLRRQLFVVIENLDDSLSLTTPHINQYRPVTVGVELSEIIEAHNWQYGVLQRQSGLENSHAIRIFRHDLPCRRAVLFMLPGVWVHGQTGRFLEGTTCIEVVVEIYHALKEFVVPVTRSGSLDEGA